MNEKTIKEENESLENLENKSLENNEAQNSQTMIDLEDAQKKLWLHQGDPPKTTQEALARVSQMMIDCIGAFQDEQLLTAQSYLEDTLAQVLIAMKTLNISPSRALERSVDRLVAETKQQRVFHIYSDRVEIQVGSDIRGGWPLYSHDDYEAVVALARTFSCQVIHHETQQLELFTRPNSPVPRTEPTIRHRVPNYYTSVVPDSSKSSNSKTSNNSGIHPQLTLISNDRSS